MQNIKSRILLKTDTTANWNKAANSFTPQKGEVCIYSDRFQITDKFGQPAYIPGIKIGDGNKFINNLEFITPDYITDQQIIDLFN